MVGKSLKSIKNRSTHCAIRLVLIGKDAHRKGKITYVRIGLKPSKVISVAFLDQN